MLNQLYWLLLQKIKFSRWTLIYILLLALCNSCTSASPPPDVELKINTIQAAARPGVYNVVGTTNLPDDSRIAIAAIRYLQPTQTRSLNPRTNTYSILARQIVPVNQGKWQTTLNLWQVAPDGQYQEVWQLSQPQQAGYEPATKIKFVATYEPTSQSSSLQQLQQLQGSSVRFTAEGEEYVQASQSLPIAVASGRTTSPTIQPEDINGGWGNRSELKAVSANTVNVRPRVNKTSQTNAPLSATEFLR